MAAWCRMTMTVITERRRSMYRSRWAMSLDMLGRDSWFAVQPWFKRRLVQCLTYQPAMRFAERVLAGV
jgi:hypothetical protein